MCLTFFKSAVDFRTWLKANHAKVDMLWVGYYKVSTRESSMRWEESVEEALCFGWIDGLRKSIDEESYKIRFSPRKPGSHWSNKNIKMIEKLMEEGRMQPTGLQVYRQRDASKTGKAAYEQDTVKLKKEYEEKIKANKKAWIFFQGLPPGYTKTSVHWVMRAKRETTRLRRLNILIESCEENKKIPLLRR